MAVVFSNNAKTTLASDISASATSISVADGGVFPTISGSDYAYVTFEDTGGNVEIVKVTALSGNTLTVVRAQDNTTASAFSSGDKCELRLTAAGLNEVSAQADTDTNTTYSAGTGLSLTGTTFANTAPDQTVSLTGSGATSITGAYPSFTISSTDTNTVYSLPLASSSTRGGVKIGYSENGKNYPVELSSEKMFVNVPWTDTNTTYSVGDGGLTQKNFTTTLKTKLDGIEAGATADQTASEILTAIKTVDGAGSGLDADLLDGQHASAFLTGNQTITLSGDVSGSGTTSIAVTVADDSHNHIISNVDGLQTALDGKVDDSQVLTNVPSGAVFTDTTYSVGDGGLTEINFTSADHTKLNGIETGATADQTAAQILTAIKTVDGAGSGLDADLLDGQHASAFQASGTYNTIIGTDSDINTSGSTIIDNIYVTDGVITSMGTRTLTLGDLGYTGETNATADQTASEILTAIKTVDGSGSGLDADLLDGQQASAFAPAGGSLGTNWNANKLIADSGANIVSTEANPFRWQRSSTGQTGQDDNITVHVDDSNIYFTHNNDADGDASGFHFRRMTGGAAQTLLSIDASTVSYKSNGIWHAGNDGSGSGLDADTVDGVQASSFVRSDATDIKTGTLNLRANLDMRDDSATATRYVHLPRGGGVTFYGDGSTTHSITSRNSSNSATDDLLISSYGAVYVALDRNNNDTGTANFVITKNGTTQELFKVDGETGAAYVNGSTVWNSGNDGSGSGLDADTVDGLHESTFMRRSANSQLDMNNNDIVGVDQIVHEGDTNTYMQFHAADQWRVVTGGVERLEVNNTAVVIPGTLNVRGAIDLADSDILRFGSADDVEFFFNGSHFYLDLNSGGNNFYIRDGTTTRFTFDDAGHFTATGNVTAYSDRRLKDDIQPIKGALEKVGTLSGNTYQRNDLLDKDPDRRYAGVIAQEVEVVLPEAVSESEDGTKTVDYNAVIALLVESVKELKAEVEQLKGNA